MTVPVQKPGRSSRQDYRTPKEFLAAVKRLLEIDEFAVDLAASALNTVAKKYHTETVTQAWDHWGTDWAWLNPPYAHIGLWVEKAYLAHMNIAMLVPASAGANWWKEWVHRKAKVLFLNGRLAFMPEKPKWLYIKDCALLLYGPSAEAYPAYDIWTWRS